eukprot:8966-Chlamydomonas_euryale.AAC.1
MSYRCARYGVTTPARTCAEVWGSARCGAAHLPGSDRLHLFLPHLSSSPFPPHTLPPHLGGSLCSQRTPFNSPWTLLLLPPNPLDHTFSG